MAHFLRQHALSFHSLLPRNCIHSATKIAENAIFFNFKAKKIAENAKHFNFAAKKIAENAIFLTLRQKTAEKCVFSTHENRHDCGFQGAQPLGRIPKGSALWRGLGQRPIKKRRRVWR
jgi:hypothetical protein